MSRHLPIVILSGVLLVGCEVGPRSNIVPTGTGDTAASDTGDLGTSQGTQVGSEGFWGCPIDGLEDLSPTEPIDGIGVPDELAAAALGTWNLTFVSAATAIGALQQSATAFSLVRSSGPCTDYVAVNVEGTVDLAGTKVATRGYLGLRPENTTFALTALDAAEAVAAVWATAAPEPGNEYLRLSAEIAAEQLTGTVGYTACGPNEPGCPDLQLLFDLAGVR